MFCERRIFCVSGTWEVADVPGADHPRRVRATLHEHSHLFSERVLADRSLDLSDAFHRLIVYLQEAISPLSVGEGQRAAGSRRKQQEPSRCLSTTGRRLAPCLVHIVGAGRHAAARPHAAHGAFAAALQALLLQLPCDHAGDELVDLLRCLSVRAQMQLSDLAQGWIVEAKPHLAQRGVADRGKVEGRIVSS